MRVFVLLAVRQDPAVVHPPSVWQLLHCARRTHARSCRATSAAFLHCRDALFQRLHRVTGVRNTEGGADVDKKQGKVDEVLRSSSAISDASAPHFFFFSALMDVGGDEDEVEVISMILCDLCRGWPGTAAHVEVCRRALVRKESDLKSPTSKQQELNTKDIHILLSRIEREETLLVQVAESIEADARTQEAYLRRWGVDSAWDYAKELQGRAWFYEAGYVAVLPKSVCSVVDLFLTRELSDGAGTACSVPDAVEVHRLNTVFSAALANAVLERALTDDLNRYFDTRMVPQRLYDGAFHQPVVAVPPAVACFLSQLPTQLLHDCVLLHTHDWPLSPSGRHVPSAGYAESSEECVVVPVACPNALFPLSLTSPSHNAEVAYDVGLRESQHLAELFHEYDVLLTNKGAVRVVLPQLSRYVFTLLLCQCELPSSLMAPFIRRHASLIAEMQLQTGEDVDGGGAGTLSRVAPTEEEVVLGMKVTWAVQRWARALRTTTLKEACAYPLWDDHIRNFSDQYRDWVRLRMQEAQRKVKHVLDVKTHNSTTTSIGSTLPNDTTVLSSNGQRWRVLCELERTLFAPRAVTFRGSTTDWLMTAVREVGEQYADVPASLFEDENPEANSANPQTTNGVTSSLRSFDDELLAQLSEPREGYGVATASASDEESDDDGDESASDSDEGRQRDEDAASDEEDAVTLMAHMDELEAALQTEMQYASRAAGFGSSTEPLSATTSSQGVKADLPTGLFERDMTAVSQNELFLHHVQLFGAELAKR